MRILDIKKDQNQTCEHKRLLHAAITFAAITVFLFIFNFIYTSFSFGEYSVYMQRMFLIPLCGGLIPVLILLIVKKERLASRIIFNLWNSGLACFVFGCLVKGIVNISGRFTSADQPYWYVGIAFLFAAAIFSIITKPKQQFQKQ